MPEFGVEWPCKTCKGKGYYTESKITGRLKRIGDVQTIINTRVVCVTCGGSGVVSRIFAAAREIFNDA